MKRPTAGIRVAHANDWNDLYSAILLIGLLTATTPNQSYGQQPMVSVGANDIGGVVTGANGAEAGVWVIAETKDLPTPYAKIVVTDDQGRYLIPDLPKANYSVWVRGYGLADSAKVQAQPGNWSTCGCRRRERSRRRAKLSADLLVLAAAGAEEGRVPVAKDQVARRVAEHRQEWRLPVLPPMGTPGTRTSPSYLPTERRPERTPGRGGWQLAAHKCS